MSFKGSPSITMRSACLRGSRTPTCSSTGFHQLNYRPLPKGHQERSVAKFHSIMWKKVPIFAKYQVYFALSTAMIHQHRGSRGPARSIRFMVFGVGQNMVDTARQPSYHCRKRNGIPNNGINRCYFNPGMQQPHHKMNLSSRRWLFRFERKNDAKA